MRCSSTVGAVLAVAVVLAGWLLLGGAARAGEEKLEVVTTLGVLKDIAERIGGEHVVVRALCDPRQDPHFVQPRPTLMKKVRGADVFIEIGLQLELWAQKVIDGSGNPGIQQGQPGRIVASTGIRTLEAPAVLSRAWGDIHPYGNPHVWLDPINAKRIAERIASGFEAVDPEHAGDYRARLEAFRARIDESLFGADLLEAVGSRKLTRLAERNELFEYLRDRELLGKLGGWLKEAVALRGKSIVTYHKTWVYFASRFGLRIEIEIEENAGIPPSARHRDRVIRLVESKRIPALVQCAFYDRSASDYIAGRTGAKVVEVPIDVGDAVGAPSYFDLVELLVERMSAPFRGAQ